MPICTRNGCKKEFALEENKVDICKYHPGAPVFHEGLKSWSCCSDVNKPELDFDEFMKIQGCQTGAHSTEISKPSKPKPSVPISNLQPEPSGVKDTISAASQILPHFAPVPGPQISQTTPPVPSPVDEEDDLSTPVSPGTICKRKGCGAKFVSNEESRLANGTLSTCVYHPLSPIFHEGSKGYLCCKRRVLEFDEFLKIEGCQKGRHLFVPKVSGEKKEVAANCRVDHYQTPSSICISVFAKQIDRDRSSVDLRENEVHLDLFLPDTKRFRRTLALYGPIVPEESHYVYMGTKVEITLKKKDNRSWNLLEKSDLDLGGFSLTFGVTGRTGTIGSRAPPVLAENNKTQI